MLNLQDMVNTLLKRPSLGGGGEGVRGEGGGGEGGGGRG